MYKNMLAIDVNPNLPDRPERVNITCRFEALGGLGTGESSKDNNIEGKRVSSLLAFGSAQGTNP